ncbi:MAG: hypothetical protein ABI579_06185, partial [Candidatus Sumerlaeota bacterium]
TISRAMWRALWPTWIMLVQAVIVCIFKASDTIAAALFSLMSLSATILALCSVWDQLHYHVANAATKPRLLRLIFFWKLSSTVLAVLIPSIIFGSNGRNFPAYVLVFAPLVLSAGTITIKHRYRHAVADYFQFE